MTMKNKIWLALLLLIALVGLTMSFIGKNNNTATEMSEFPASYGIYEYTWTTDTLTDDEVVTLTIPPLLLSDWEFNYTVTLDSLTGTPSVGISLEESNKRSGSEWYEYGYDYVEGFSAWQGISVSGIGSTTTVVPLNGSIISGETGTANPSKVQGVRQRIVLTGSGTQSTQYSVKVTLKKST